MDEPTEDIISIKPGKVTVRATITHRYSHRIQNSNLMTNAVIADKTGTAKVVWFSKSPKEDLKVGAEYVFSGIYQLKYGRLALQSPKYETTGEEYAVEELAESPFILPAWNYPSKKFVWHNWPDLIGAAIVWILIVGGIAAYAIASHHQEAPTASNTSDTSTIQAASPPSQALSSASTSLGSHNGFPEISPGQAEANSKCIDVTSIDYDWNDDVLCTRPDGSQFYTNYTGGKSADTTFEK